MPEEIVTLSKEALSKHLDRILDIDKGILGEEWTANNFYFDLPYKWVASKAILIENKLVGFLIASEKGKCFHIHRLAISHTLKGIGLGRKLLEAFFVQMEELGIKEITLKVDERNKSAIDFYLKMNFSIIKPIGSNLWMKRNL